MWLVVWFGVWLVVLRLVVCEMVCRVMWRVASCCIRLRRVVLRLLCHRFAADLSFRHQATLYAFSVEPASRRRRIVFVAGRLLLVPCGVAMRWVALRCAAVLHVVVCVFRCLWWCGVSGVVWWCVCGVLCRFALRCGSQR